MISNRLAKGDPRLTRLFPDTKQEAGFTAAAYPGHGAPAKRVDVIVIAHGDREPRGVSGLKWRRLARGMFSVALTGSEYKALLNSPDIETIYPPQKMRLSMDKSMAAINIPAVHDPNNRFPHKGKGVVIAIIDHGFDLTHPDFIDKDGKTRVAYFFDQMQEGSTEFGKGVEYTAAKINDALRRRDRKLAYKILGHEPAPGAHGTHVAGIAAGNGSAPNDGGPRYMGAAPEATLICVNVPAGSDGQMTEDSFVADALRYVFARAADGMEDDGFLSRFRRSSKSSWPCVVNLSYSRNEAGHDGGAMVERLIDLLLAEDTGRAVVVSAGNCANAALHAAWRYQGGASMHLQFEIPVVPAPHYEVELWYSSRDTISAQLVAPDGSLSSLVSAGDERSDELIGTTSVSIWSKRFVPYGGDAQIFVTLDAQVAAGTWTILLEADSASRGGVLDAWLDSTHMPVNRARFLNGADTASTIGTPATARSAVSVGSIDHHANPVITTESSGRGPTRDGRPKPEVLAPGINIMSCCAQGGLSTGDATLAFYVSDSGTSMSAPHLTGVIACMFEEYGALTASQIQKVLIAAAHGDSHDETTGHGLIDAGKAVELVQQYIRTVPASQ